MSFLIGMAVVIVVVANKSIDLVFHYCCQRQLLCITKVTVVEFHIEAGNVQYFFEP